MNVIQLADKLRTEADAYLLLEELRWGDSDPICPHCDHDGATYLNPENGTARRTRTGTMSERRVWQCHSCRKQFSVLTGTVMHGTKISVRIWIMVFAEMCAAKNGIAAREIQRRYGVTSRTAWHLMHRIREAMKNDGLVQSMRGVIVADETWIGGSVKNRHNSYRHPKGGPVPVVPGARQPHDRGPGEGKVSVLALIDTATLEVRSRVIADVTGATLRKAISEQVDMANSVLYTDEAASYRTFASEFAAHETVNHSDDEYVRYEGDRVITSNDAECFFSQLKRSIDGTHHHVSAEHLPRYLAEFDFRHSTRMVSDDARMRRLIGQVHGKRLTYKRITAA